MRQIRYANPELFPARKTQFHQLQCPFFSGHTQRSLLSPPNSLLPRPSLRSSRQGAIVHFAVGPSHAKWGCSGFLWLVRLNWNNQSLFSECVGAGPMKRLCPSSAYHRTPNLSSFLTKVVHTDHTKHHQTLAALHRLPTEPPAPRPAGMVHQSHPPCQAEAQNRRQLLAISLLPPRWDVPKLRRDPEKVIRITPLLGVDLLGVRGIPGLTCPKQRLTTPFHPHRTGGGSVHGMS